MFNQYFQNIFETLKSGDAREESFYSSLESFIDRFGESQNKKIKVISLPKKYKGQLPDFRIREKGKIVGHIEAKDFQKYPESHDLDRIENSEQLKKYRKNFANLILTNFFEFRLYRNGVLIDKVQIGRP
jgi:hypothetical protein